MNASPRPVCPFPPAIELPVISPTIYVLAPEPEIIPRGAETAELYNVIREARDATRKYNHPETGAMPKVKAAVDNVYAGAESYNKALITQENACLKAQFDWDNRNKSKANFFKSYVASTLH